MQTVFRAVLAAIVVVASHAALSEAKPRLTEIRHSVRGGTTRIVIDLTGNVDYKVYEVGDPNRIAINLPGVGTLRSLQTTSIESGVVRRIRINRLSWGSQVVLDLRETATFSDFRLAPVDNMPNRIVIDVDGTAAGATASAPITDSMAPSVGDVLNSPEARRAGINAAAAVEAAQGGREKRPIRIAIDAGHGGSDPGALGKGGATEKVLALQLARRIVRMINERGGYEAFLTRDQDVFLDLRERTENARVRGANIFVSIHLNTAPKSSARGSEVFFVRPSGAQATSNQLLRDSSKAAEQLGLEKPSTDDIMHMLVDVNQQSMMQRSSALAEQILRALDREGLPPTRKVKQRSFVVLKTISMPSVLVETGFLTNLRDHKILTSDAGKEAIARAVTDGIMSYMKLYPPPTNETGKLIVHHVRRGDTLWGISREYHTSVDSIQETNKLGGSKTIKVGQKLVIREGYETY